MKGLGGQSQNEAAVNRLTVSRQDAISANTTKFLLSLFTASLSISPLLPSCSSALRVKNRDTDFSRAVSRRFCFRTTSVRREIRRMRQDVGMIARRVRRVLVVESARAGALGCLLTGI